MKIKCHTQIRAIYLLGAICFYFTSVQVKASELSLSENTDSVTAFRDTSWFNRNSRSYFQKGKFFLNLGFNWSSYGRSDINFDGPGYDFTLEDVVGHDQPYKPSLQYNIHVGYFLSEHYSVSLGYDHMKYVMKVPQQVTISGVIDPEVSTPTIQTGQYAGSYNKETITITPELLTLEYTDGFNYVSTHVQRYDDIWVSNNRKTSLALETGIGLGAIIPRADVKLFTVGMNNKLNVAGWGASAKAGLMFNFNQSIYFLASLEAGHANMDRIYTTGRNDLDKASQKLNFLQSLYLIGIRF
jgi:hypothetical protein